MMRNPRSRELFVESLYPREWFNDNVFLQGFHARRRVGGFAQNPAESAKN